MISKAYLFIILGLSLAYRKLEVSIKVGDLVWHIQLWQLGFILACLCASYLLIRRLIRKLFRAFQWYRNYIESMTPNQAIRLILHYKLGVGDSVNLKNDDLSQDKKVYIELIKFLLGERVSGKVLSYQMHGDTLFYLSELNSCIAEGRYETAIRYLNQLIRNYGYLPLLYNKLRTCYIDTRNYDELDELNRRASQNHLLNVVQNEGSILFLKEQVEHVRELPLRLQILEKIYKLSRSDPESLLQYVTCLQKLGHFKAAIQVIKYSTESSNAFIKVATELFSTEEPRVALDIALKMQDSLLKYILIFTSSLGMGDYQTADRVILKVHGIDNNLARVLELKLCQRQANTTRLCSMVDSFSYSRSASAGKSK